MFRERREDAAGQQRDRSQRRGGERRMGVEPTRRGVALQKRVVKEIERKAAACPCPYRRLEALQHGRKVRRTGAHADQVQGDQEADDIAREKFIGPVQTVFDEMLTELRVGQVQQGLPAGSIFAIRQSTNGFLLLGTQTRLVRFDGVRFSNVHEVDDMGLKDLWVQCLQQDSDGTLWIGTQSSGLIRLSQGVATRYTRRDGLPADNIQCLCRYTL